MNQAQNARLERWLMVAGMAIMGLLSPILPYAAGDVGLQPSQSSFYASAAFPAAFAVMAVKAVLWRRRLSVSLAILAAAVGLVYGAWMMRFQAGLGVNPL